MQSRRALLLALVACSAVCASCEPYNWANWANTTTKVPIIKFPSLAPTILEVLGMQNVRGDMPQNLTHPQPILLSKIMPKLPVIPNFKVTALSTSTSEVDMLSNITAAVKSLQVPLVESTMLPQYVSALKARISQESLYLDTLASDSSKQREMCGIMPQQYLGGCVAFSLKMQAAKVQAVQSGLQVLQQMQAQLDTDMAKKLAAFNIPSDTAVGGNWLCNLGQQLDSGIKAAASSSTSGAYAAKATTAVQKLGDFLAGRWASSPWWTLQADATLPQLVATCPITV